MVALRVALIIVLLLCRGPTAIVRAIVAIYVNSVERFSFGLKSHIFEEILESFPTLADSNSSAAIIRPRVLSRIFTSCTHRSVGFVKRVMRHTVSDSPSASKTAARFNFSAFQFTSSHNNFGSTIAKTKPVASATNAFGFFSFAFDYEFAEALRREVKRSHLCIIP